MPETPDTTPSSIQQPIQNVPSPTPSSKKKFILIGGVVFFVILLIVVLIAATKMQDSSSPGTSIDALSPTPITQETPTETRKFRYIAYIKEEGQQNIWVVDQQGTNKKQVTDNNESNNYSLLHWKGYDELAYVVCKESGEDCAIIAKNVSTGEENSVVNPSSREVFLAFRFNQIGEQIAYIERLSDGRSFVQLQQGDSTRTLKELLAPLALGRDNNYSDETSLQFSPDGNHLLVINTFTQPNTAQNFLTLWVFEVETGRELFGIGTSTSFASDGAWLDNETIYYVHDNRLIQKNITNQGEITQTTFENLYDLQLSPTLDQLIFWSVTENKSGQLGTYSFAKEQFEGNIIGFSHPQWINNTQVVAMETEESSIQTGRLMMVNVKNSSTYELEPLGVTSFVIEPLQIL